MTLTLDFQGQILKKSYRRNEMAHWNGTKGMWVDRMLDSHCDFKLWPHPWPWPWIFKVKYGNCCNSTMGGLTHLEWKGCELDMMLDAQWDWPLHTGLGDSARAPKKLRVSNPFFYIFWNFYLYSFWTPLFMKIHGKRRNHHPGFYTNGFCLIFEYYEHHLKHMGLC